MIIQYLIIRFTLGNKEGNTVALQWFICYPPPTPFLWKQIREKFGASDPLLTLMIVSWRTVPSRVTQKSGIWIGALRSCHFFPSFSDFWLLSIKGHTNDAAFVGEQRGKRRGASQGIEDGIYIHNLQIWTLEALVLMGWMEKFQGQKGFEIW